MIPLLVKKQYITFLCIACTLCAAMLFSCVNNPKEIEKMSQESEKPVVWGENIEIIFSENASTKIQLITPKMEKYVKDEILTIMPDGITVFFFDSLGNKNAMLEAGYAIEYQLKKIVEAKYDVVVINEDNDTLNTEHLIWNRHTKKIYTNTYVKITTHNNEVIHGEKGMVADERFTYWRINKVRDASLFFPDEN
ncbi:MAG: LPS export ABC transporter periplasmic protein LptC [Bacteroidales bacterium]|nr:LPS export ABC transporter periplasmic protein LptC [Bacteroidales bacterium]